MKQFSKVLLPTCAVAVISVFCGCATTSSPLKDLYMKKAKLIDSKVVQVVSNSAPIDYQGEAALALDPWSQGVCLSVEVKEVVTEYVIIRNEYINHDWGGAKKSFDEPGVRKGTRAVKNISVVCVAVVNGRQHTTTNFSASDYIMLPLDKILGNLIDEDTEVEKVDLRVTIVGHTASKALSPVTPYDAAVPYKTPKIFSDYLVNKDAAARLSKKQVASIKNAEPSSKSLVSADSGGDGDGAGSDEKPVVITDLVPEGIHPKAFVHRWMLKRISEDKIKVSYDQVFDWEYIIKMWNTAMDSDGAQGVRAYDEFSSWNRWKRNIDEDYKGQGRIGATIISHKQVPSLLANYAKYAEWKEVSAREKLATGVQQDLPSVGNITCKFITPDRLLVGDWKMNAEDVLRISKLLNRVDELERIVTDRALEKTKALQEKDRQQQEEEEAKKQREAQRSQDEEKARSLLK